MDFCCWWTYERGERELSNSPTKPIKQFSLLVLPLLQLSLTKKSFSPPCLFILDRRNFSSWGEDNSAQQEASHWSISSRGWRASFSESHFTAVYSHVIVRGSEYQFSCSFHQSMIYCHDLNLFSTFIGHHLWVQEVLFHSFWPGECDRNPWSHHANAPASLGADISPILTSCICKHYEIHVQLGCGPRRHRFWKAGPKLAWRWSLVLGQLCQVEIMKLLSHKSSLVKRKSMQESWPCNICKSLDIQW